MNVVQNSHTTQCWTLAEYGNGDHQRRKIKVPNRECFVGRADDVDLCIPLSSISKRHARIWFEGDRLHVEDLGSTNGTHKNGERIHRTTVQEGDLLQFANSVFRVERQTECEYDGTMEEGLIPWAKTLQTFGRLLSERAVVPHFQPIMTMDRQSMPAFEVLARSDLAELKHPAAMFSVADRLGQQAALSELMRDEASRQLMLASKVETRVFLNTHPVEFGTERLADSLTLLAHDFPLLKLRSRSMKEPLPNPNRCGHCEHC